VEGSYWEPGTSSDLHLIPSHPAPAPELGGLARDTLASAIFPAHQLSYAIDLCQGQSDGPYAGP
jgi:hypothetical protein